MNLPPERNQHPKKKNNTTMRSPSVTLSQNGSPVPGTHRSNGQSPMTYEEAVAKLSPLVRALARQAAREMLAQNPGQENEIDIDTGTEHRSRGYCGIPKRGPKLMLKQPNPRFQQPSDLSVLQREHYEVARSIEGVFSSSEFYSAYLSKFPERSPGSISPSDYCFGRENEGNVQHPRFLLWNGAVGYVFVGLDGRMDRGATVRRRAKTYRANARRKSQNRPLLLVPAVAEEAIRRFNSDEVVMRQEAMVLDALPDGLIRDRLADQLWAIARGYSTRTSNHDISVVSTAIDDDWENWRALLSRVTELEEATPDRETTRALLAYFLAQRTDRLPRSFATKVLHFALPKTFVAVDEYAANSLADEIGTLRWSTTANLDVDGMADWYFDYLNTIHAIGQDNRALLAKLIDLDSSTAYDHRFDRIRGFPKVLDKILWWCGRELRKGRPLKAFEPI